MKSSTTPDPTPLPRRQAADPVQLAGIPPVAGAPNGPTLRSLPPENQGRRTGDESVVEAHLGHMDVLLALPPGQARAVAATQYLATLEDCRRDAIAVRDVSVQAMNTVSGLGGVRIAAALGLNASRGQQLIYRAQQTHQDAAQHIARLRRRLAIHRRTSG